MSASDIIHIPERRVFELREGKLIADIQYEPVADGICVTHTYVPPELAGQGIAGKLAGFVLETARNEGWKVETSCSYFHAYLLKHPEYRDLQKG